MLSFCSNNNAYEEPNLQKHHKLSYWFSEMSFVEVIRTIFLLLRISILFSYDIPQINHIKIVLNNVIRTWYDRQDTIECTFCWNNFILLAKLCVPKCECERARTVSDRILLLIISHLLHSITFNC